MTRESKPPQADAPPRLKHEAAHPLSQLVRDVHEEPPLSDIALARVHRQVLESARPRRRRAYPMVLGFRMGVVAALLLVGASVGAAAVLSVRWFGLQPPSALPADEATTNTAAAKSAARRRHPRALPPVPAEAPAAEAPQEPLAAAPPVAPPRPQARPAARVALRAAPPFERVDTPSRLPSLSPPALHVEDVPVRAANPPDTSAIAQETAELSQALRGLRRGERAAAIFALRGYLKRHPDGVYRQEAEVALLTALVESGAHDEAKAQLAAVPAALQASPALRLLRAELSFPRACAEAAPLFDEALAATPAGALRERALYGAAMADWRCGDRGRGISRMQQFLQVYPSSPRAANVKEHLARANSF